MSAEVHKCKHGSLKEVTAIEKTLIAQGFVQSEEGQCQKNIPCGEYVVVSLANVAHHQNGEIQYRIAWVEVNDE